MRVIWILLLVLTLLAACPVSSDDDDAGDDDAADDDAGDDDTEALRVIAVGEGGAILEFDGASWTLADSPTEHELHDVVLIDADRAIAVGSHGTILVREQGVWNSVPCPTTAGLGDVALVGEETGVIVGEDGLILHYDGADWTEADSPVQGAGLYLMAVDLLDADHGIAVGGDNGTDLHAVVLFFDGESWTVERQGLDRHLESAGMASETYAAIGGFRDKGDPLNFKHWDGQYWSLIDDIEGVNRFVTGIDFLHAGLGYAVTDGDGRLLRYDGAGWSVEASVSDITMEPGMLMDVCIASSDLAVALAEGPTVLVRDGSGWSAVPEGTFDTSMVTLWGIDCLVSEG